MIGVKCDMLGWSWMRKVSHDRFCCNNIVIILYIKVEIKRCFKLLCIISEFHIFMLNTIQILKKHTKQVRKIQSSVKSTIYFCQNESRGFPVFLEYHERLKIECSWDDVTIDVWYSYCPLHINTVKFYLNYKQALCIWYTKLSTKYCKVLYYGISS